MFETLTDGLRFPESPRWHDGHLWFAEKRAQRVVRLESDSTPTTMVTVPADPGGLGWDPDGNLMVVSMGDRQLLRHRHDTLEVVADLRDLTKVKCNDMVVDARGGAYVGDFGYDLGAGAPAAPGVSSTWIPMVNQRSWPQISASRTEQSSALTAELWWSPSRQPTD